MYAGLQDPSPPLYLGEPSSQSLSMLKDTAAAVDIFSQILAFQRGHNARQDGSGEAADGPRTSQGQEQEVHECATG